MLAVCAPKPFLYQGKYISMNVTHTPIDEFLVDSTVVIAFGFRGGTGWTGTIYQFAVIQNGTQVRTIEVEWLDIYNRRTYSIEEDFPAKNTYLIYKIFETKPAYEEVKGFIPGIVKGKMIPTIRTNY